MSTVNVDQINCIFYGAVMPQLNNTFQSVSASLKKEGSWYGNVQ